MCCGICIVRTWLDAVDAAEAVGARALAVERVAIGILATGERG